MFPLLSTGMAYFRKEAAGLMDQSASPSAQSRLEIHSNTFSMLEIKLERSGIILIIVRVYFIVAVLIYHKYLIGLSSSSYTVLRWPSRSSSGVRSIGPTSTSVSTHLSPGSQELSTKLFSDMTSTMVSSYQLKRSFAVLINIPDRVNCHYSR